MTYFLDGREISAADLAGKSGKVKIRIDYTNNSSQNAKINGKKETIYTPFMMATGMILPTDTFTNVEVTNGKVISDGNNSIVLGIGFPGLYDSLKLGDLDSFKDKESPGLCGNHCRCGRFLPGTDRYRGNYRYTE